MSAESVVLSEGPCTGSFSGVGMVVRTRRRRRSTPRARTSPSPRTVATMADDPEVDSLLTVPPDEFVAARNALAKSLRAAGRKQEAAAVAALRRPTAVDWALNMV